MTPLPPTWWAPSTSPAARSMSTSPNSRSRPKARSASRASRRNLPGSASSTRRTTASRRSEVTARLDAEAREKLGIKVNHLVHGPTPITLQIARLGQGATPPVMNVQADLTDAQLLFGGLGWTKPAGRAATVQLDVVPKEDGSTVLDNLKILGDDIDIRGGIALDANQHLKEFYFSDFSVNHLTHIEISATVRDDQVLDIKAEGPSFDGRQFFQSLFSAGQIDGSAEPVDPFGVDLTARIGTVTGFYDADRQGRRSHHEEAQRPARCARCQRRAERQIAGRRSSRAERERAPDQGRSPRCRRRIPPGWLLSERRGRRGVAGSQSRRRRPGDEERDAVGARFRRARRFGGERRPHRSELGGGAGRAQAAGHQAAHRCSISCARRSPSAAASSGSRTPI